MTEKTKLPERFVLLLEDNTEHAELLTEILDQHFSPIVIHAVDTVEDAMTFLIQYRYDFILTDSSIDGKPITKQIGDILSVAKETPLLVITGSGDERTAAELVRLGAAEYLVKTRDTLEELPEIIGRHLGKRRTRRSGAIRKKKKETGEVSAIDLLLQEVSSLDEKANALTDAASSPKEHSDLLLQIAKLRELIEQNWGRSTPK